MWINEQIWQDCRTLRVRFFLKNVLQSCQIFILIYTFEWTTKPFWHLWYDNWSVLMSNHQLSFAKYCFSGSWNERLMFRSETKIVEKKSIVALDNFFLAVELSKYLKPNLSRERICCAKKQHNMISCQFWQSSSSRLLILSKPACL